MFVKGLPEEGRVKPRGKEKQLYYCCCSGEVLAVNACEILHTSHFSQEYRKHGRCSLMPRVMKLNWETKDVVPALAERAHAVA